MGSFAARQGGRRDPGMFDAKRRAALQRMIKQSPDATLAELQVRIEDELGLECCLSTIWYTLRKLGVTLKKSPSGHSNTRVRT